MQDEHLRGLRLPRFESENGVQAKMSEPALRRPGRACGLGFRWTIRVLLLVYCAVANAGEVESQALEPTTPFPPPSRSATHAVATTAGSPYRGVVTFGGLPLPGATIKVTIRRQIRRRKARKRRPLFPTSKAHTSSTIWRTEFGRSKLKCSASRRSMQT